MILKIDALHPEPERIAQAIQTLKQGGVVAYPTETFYALGADFSNDRAIARIFEIKGRSFQSPIALIAGNKEDLIKLTDHTPDVAERLMQAFWPGPLTLVFKAASRVSPLLTAGTGKIGVRISSHPVAQALASALGAPITATSANRSGQKECTTAEEVRQAIGGLPGLILDGNPTPGGKGSTFVDVTQNPPHLLREGVVSFDRLSLMFQVT